MWTSKETARYRTFINSSEGKTFSSNLSVIIDITDVLYKLPGLRDVKSQLYSYHLGIQDPDDVDVDAYIPRQRKIITLLKNTDVVVIDHLVQTLKSV